MNVLRTPDEAFTQLKDYPFAPNYLQIAEGKLRLHYIDEGQNDSETILLMHGEPTWSYLYRKMIPILVEAGYRCVAPDLIGFGKSDKLPEMSDYSYQAYVEWMSEFITQLDLRNMTLVCQDWGGLIGLRLVAAFPERFKRVSASNTFLPTGQGKPSEAFLQWQAYSQKSPKFEIGKIVNGGCVRQLSETEIAAYDAPFPDDSYKAAARIFPSLVPTSPDDPAIPANIKAWEVLQKWDKPFLTAFSDQDPITKGGDAYFQKVVPGTKGQNHQTLAPGGHFVQEDCGEAWANLLVKFIQNN